MRVLSDAFLIYLCQVRSELADTCSADGTGTDCSGAEIQFFYEIDMTDVAAAFILRTSADDDCCGGGQLLLSHGWVNGTLLGEDTIQKVAHRFDREDIQTWPEVAPSPGYVFVDRHGKVLESPSFLRIHQNLLRPRSLHPPMVSLLFMRWGGHFRVGEEADQDGEPIVADYRPETFGGWGEFGAAPSDWYIAGVVEHGALVHPKLAANRDVEVLSIFLDSTEFMINLSTAAAGVAAKLRGKALAAYWMLWPASYEADFESAVWAGYVDRRAMFPLMGAFENVGIVSAFPHPASLYERITSKEWHVELAADAEHLLPAATFVQTRQIKQQVEVAAKAAVQALGTHPQVRGNATRGVVKMGWAWEAKSVFFWKTERELQSALKTLATEPFLFVDKLIVQEWVNFDFEMRLSFAPPTNWTPSQVLNPVHTELNKWTSNSGRQPTGFKKVSWEEATQFLGGSDQINDAHQLATSVSQRLLKWLYSIDPRPVPLIRLDFMVKSSGDAGKMQVTFGEFCEAGGSVLAWREGPMLTWRQTLDWALRFGGLARG